MTEYPRLKDLGRWLSGGTPPKDDESLWEGDVPWISAKDIDSTHLREPTTFITEDAARRHSRLVDAGALLLIVRGMALAHGLPVVLTDRRVAFNQDLRALVPEPSMDPRFLHYAFMGRRHVFGAHIDQAAHGTARVIDSLHGDRVWLPSAERQGLLADFLDRECERIADLERHVDRFRTLASSHTQAVRREALKADAIERCAPIASCPPGWPRLRHVVDAWFAGGTPTSDEPSYWCEPPEGLPWVAIGDMSRRECVGRTAKHVTEAGLDAAGLRIAPAGSVLLAMYASVGEVAELGRAATFNQAILGLYIADEDRRAIVREWLHLLQPLLPALAKSNTQANLTSDVVRSLPLVPLSSQQQQSALAAIREARQREAQMGSYVDRIWSRLAEYRDALITETVTGQLDVTLISEQQMDERAHAAMEGEPLEVVR